MTFAASAVLISGVALAAPTPSTLAQARKLYAPVAAFDHATTAAQRGRVITAELAEGRRLDACQKPFMKWVGNATANSPKFKVETIYSYGSALQDFQYGEAVVAGPLGVAQRAWATMRLGNPVLRGYARGQAGVIAASFYAARVHSCLFLRHLARHNYSLAWAKHSRYGITARGFMKNLIATANPVAAGANYLTNQHLLTSQQRAAIINFLGLNP